MPYGVEPGAIAGNIRRALAGEGISGSLSISAYCDTHTLPYSVRKGLSASNVNLQDVPRGGKDSSDKAILVDMLLWAVKHPPPAHVLLISNDQGFSKALHALRQLQYRVSISCRSTKGGGDSAANLLRGAANDEWEWPLFARGTCVALHLVPNVSIVTKAEACDVSPSEILRSTQGTVLNSATELEVSKPASGPEVMQNDVKDPSIPANIPDENLNDVKNSEPANGPEKKTNDAKSSSKPANVQDRNLTGVKDSKLANGAEKKPDDAKRSSKPASTSDKNQNDVKNSKPANGPNSKPNIAKSPLKPAKTPDKNQNDVKDSKPVNGPSNKPNDAKSPSEPASTPDNSQNDVKDLKPANGPNDVMNSLKTRPNINPNSVKNSSSRAKGPGKKGTKGKG